jgi:hypothetical protein
MEVCTGQGFNDFQYYWEATSKPFEWKFTRSDLAIFLAELSVHERPAA